MNLFMKIAISVLLLISTSESFAKKRFKIPSDDKVMLHVGQKTVKPLYQELDPTNINIFVWNMYKGSIPSWGQDYIDLTKYYDVLLLQEMWMNGAMKKVINSDDTFNYHMATSFLDRKRSYTPSGVAIASYVEPELTFFQRSKYREPFIKTPKMTVFADFALKGMDKRLRVASIHAINFVSKRKLKHQLHRVAQALKNHDGPVVLGGDFNTWSKKKIRIMRRAMQDAGLVEVQFKSWGQERMKKFGNILDYVWVRGVDVLDSNVYHKIRSSDHKAMSVRISIQGAFLPLAKLN